MKVAEVLAAMGVTPARAGLWAPHIASACNEFGVDTPDRLARFAAQTGHESALYSTLQENLNYSGDALQKIFKKYYPTPSAAAGHARKPQLIANRIYAGRMGNGDEASGDGYKYRGRGILQITGRENYAACGEVLGLPLVDLPDGLLDPSTAARSAGWFWASRKLNDIADFTALSIKINGGRIGLEHRLALYAKAQGALREAT